MRTQNPLIILLHYHSDSLNHCNMVSAKPCHVCIIERGDFVDMPVDMKTVCCVFVVNSYQVRRVETERLCIAGVVVWH